METKEYIKPIRLITILSVLAIAILLSGCGTKSEEGTVKTSQVAGENTAENQPVKEFVMDSFTEVIDDKYYPQYTIKEMVVNKGDLVRIKITNIKGMHDFKIDEFEVYAETPLDELVTVEFVADQAGEFEYYCTQPGHRQNGHWGTLKVLE